MNATTALLHMTLAGGPCKPLRKLLSTYGSADQVVSAGIDSWQQAGCTLSQCQALASPNAKKLALGENWLQQAHHHVIGYTDKDYPALLRTAPNPPLALFVDGDIACLWQAAIAIVGSRTPSAGGCDNAALFAAALAQAGLTIASGLASGIDAAAHRAVLKRGGRTYAFIGNGPDITYPSHHRQLQAQVAENGAVVSEYPPGTKPRPGFFPARNRLIAALTLGTLVVEAAERSGALITARLAVDAGREVFAIPGSIHNPMARGCHRLIRDGATLVTQPEDVLQGISTLAGNVARGLRASVSDITLSDKKQKQASPINTDTLTFLSDPDSQRLWRALSFDPVDMDTLVQRSKLTAAQVSSLLLMLELEGHISSAHGRYARC